MEERENKQKRKEGKNKRELKENPNKNGGEGGELDGGGGCKVREVGVRKEI